MVGGGPAVFEGSDELISHPAGHLPLAEGGPATRVPGFSFAQPHPNPAVDALRTPSHPSSLTWWMDLTPTQTNAAFELQHVEVSVTNLDGVGELNLPALYDTEQAANTSVALDADSGQITVTDLDSGLQRFQGSLNDFFSAPPAGLTLDINTIRAFTFDCEALGDALVLPTSERFVAVLSEGDDRVEITLPDRRSGTDLGWVAAVVDGPGSVPAASGGPGVPLVVLGDLSALPEFPGRALVRVSVATDAANSPLEVPLLLSREPPVGDDDDSAGDDDDSATTDDDDSTDDLVLGPDGANDCNCSASPRPAPLLGWLALLGAVAGLRRRRCA